LAERRFWVERADTGSRVPQWKKSVLAGARPGAIESAATSPTFGGQGAGAEINPFDHD